LLKISTIENKNKRDYRRKKKEPKRQLLQHNKSSEINIQNIILHHFALFLDFISLKSKTIQTNSANIVMRHKNVNRWSSPILGIMTEKTAAVKVPVLSIRDDTVDIAALSFSNYLVSSIDITPEMLLYGPPWKIPMAKIQR
jgi:hypothetical protein